MPATKKIDVAIFLKYIEADLVESSEPGLVARARKALPARDADEFIHRRANCIEREIERLAVSSLFDHRPLSKQAGVPFTACAGER
jgi:hypothetical protein